MVGTVQYIGSLEHYMVWPTMFYFWVSGIDNFYFTASPCLTTNSLTDHCTWYNLQVHCTYANYYISKLRQVYCIFRHFWRIFLELTGTITTTLVWSTTHHFFWTSFLIIYRGPSHIHLGLMVIFTSLRKSNLVFVHFLVCNILHFYCIVLVSSNQWILINAHSMM